MNTADLQNVLDTTKPAIHAELSRMKKMLEDTIRLLFNPEESKTKLMLVGAVVLRIGVQMCVAAMREFGMSEDKAYEVIAEYISTWRKNDQEDRGENSPEKKEEGPANV